MAVFSVYPAIGTGRTLKPNQGCIQGDAVFPQIVDLLIAAPDHENNHCNQHPLVCKLDFEQCEKQINGIKQVSDVTGGRKEVNKDFLDNF